MYIIQSSPVSPFKQQPAFLRLAAISPLCLYLQESGGYMAAESPLEAKIQISSFGKNPIWVREGGPTLRGRHTCPSSRMTTLSGSIDSPCRVVQDTKNEAASQNSPQVGFFIAGSGGCTPPLPDGFSPKIASPKGTSTPRVCTYIISSNNFTH